MFARRSSWGFQNSRLISENTAAMFSDDLMGRGTPVLRRIVLPACLNVVTHVTIDFRTGIWSHWAILKWFRKARWVATHYKKGGYDMLN